jgi:DNA polymerase (family 10)
MPTYKVPVSRTIAEQVAQELEQALLQLGFKRVQFAGSLRRREVTIGDLDVIVEGDLSLLAKLAGAEFKEQGAARVTIIWHNMQINLFQALPENWGSHLLYLTGPKGSTIGLRVKAKMKGWILNQYGLFDSSGNKIASETEEEIFRALNHPMKPPELRGK